MVELIRLQSYVAKTPRWYVYEMRNVNVFAVRHEFDSALCPHTWTKMLW